jgi:hypothetical protein
MDGAELYEMLTEELDTEGIQALPWEELNDRYKIAWGKLARRLDREQPRQAMLSSYPD